MGMSDYSPHQQKIIKNYYKNQDGIQSQRLAELVTELFLAEGKKRNGVWDRIVSAMEKLGVPQVRIDHLRQQDDPALVAKLVEELQQKK